MYFFAGYAEDHAGDVFRMIKISTGRVSETRDVTFLGIMYGEIFDSDNFLQYNKKGRKSPLVKNRSKDDYIEIDLDENNSDKDEDIGETTTTDDEEP